MAMFSKVLVANRGELAVRIIRACRDLGIRTAAVYSQVDRDSLHVRLADEAVCVGPGPAADSYLNIPNIISAALKVHADAVHPGAGFLAENAYFAEICGQYGLAYVGPPAEVIAAVADKSATVAAAKTAGLPTLPTSERPLADLQTAKSELQKLGFPVILKATAGGGGRGMRVVKSAAELAVVFPQAQAEARNSFSNPDLYLERLLLAARHIEVQILADAERVTHLGDRECSVQRRHQKVIEEAPAPGLSESLRGEIAEAAIKLARALGYSNAGTVEFLLSASGEYFFIEINSRLQVEHPITEAVTGVDIVKEQLRIAAGAGLGVPRSGAPVRGHAIECRVLAEDPTRNWAPANGTIQRCNLPGGPGVRVDSHVYSGYEVPPHYDSLLAKVICWGADRAEALQRMRRAIAECEIEGVLTNVAFLKRVLYHPDFTKGAYDLDRFVGDFNGDGRRSTA